MPLVSHLPYVRLVQLGLDIASSFGNGKLDITHFPTSYFITKVQCTSCHKKWTYIALNYSQVYLRLKSAALISLRLEVERAMLEVRSRTSYRYTESGTDCVNDVGTMNRRRDHLRSHVLTGLTKTKSLIVVQIQSEIGTYEVIRNFLWMVRVKYEYFALSKNCTILNPKCHPR